MADVKPTVIYSDAAGPILHDAPAILCVLDHPIRGSGWVRTTPVLYIDGEILETHNTIYRPAERLPIHDELGAAYCDRS